MFEASDSSSTGLVGMGRRRAGLVWYRATCKQVQSQTNTVRCMPAHNRAEQRFEGLAEDGTACQGERQT